MGEATSDFFVHKWSPVIAVLLAGVEFCFALWWQLSRATYRPAPYWWCVVMVSVFGTMCADVVHVGLHVAYLVSTIAYALALAVIFYLWYRVEGTLSIHSITTRQREIFYWLAITATFALGTAGGDLTAHTLHLGFFGSGVMFLAFFLVPTLWFAILRRNAIATFWSAYILTRPLGASFADWFGVSRAHGGLNHGPGHVSLILTVAILLVISVLAIRTPRVRRP